jgi:hypothetical protein
MGSDEGPVQKQMEAGTADLAWDTEVPVSDLHRLRSVRTRSPSNRMARSSTWS